MKEKFFWIVFSCFVSFTLVLFYGCKKSPSSMTDAGARFGGTDWEEKWGLPQYGGTLTSRASSLDVISYDPLNMIGGRFQYMYDGLFYFDWALDRSKWSYPTGWVPNEFKKGLLAESWEQTDPTTVTVHLRKGVKWQNKAPVNGREFTSDDVVFNYDRILGTGHGYTQPNPFAAGQLASVKNVVAVDKYTIQFNLKSPTAMAMIEVLGSGAGMVAPEWVALGGPPKNAPPPPGGPGGPPPPGPPKGSAIGGGPLSDWHNAVGTGPWILKNVVRGSSITFVKNPNYWGYDERYPKNKIPYADEVKVLAIPDISTAVAALRTRKVDLQSDPEDFFWEQAQSLNKSNPEIITVKLPNPSHCLDMRCDKKPFNDIRVRKALQMAIDRKSIAKSKFGGVVDGIPTGLVTPLYADYAYTYDKWSQELKDTYSYNPDKAKKLLAEAGYPDGFKTKCLVGSAEDITLLQIIKSQFMDIGVDMEIDVEEMGTYMNLVMSGKNEAMDMERWAGLMGAPNTPFSLGVRTSKSMFNFTHNNDAEYDKLYEKMQSATDLDDAKKIAQELDKYALEQCWAVHICPTVQYIAWQPYVKGYSGEFIGFADTASATRARIWVDQEARKALLK